MAHRFRTLRNMGIQLLGNRYFLKVSTVTAVALPLCWPLVLGLFSSNPIEQVIGLLVTLLLIYGCSVILGTLVWVLFIHNYPSHENQR
jgi:hypothetical protein